MTDALRRWPACFGSSCRVFATLFLVAGLFLHSAPIAWADAPTESIDFTQETLENGLHVIYAPLHQAPVVQVRVLYHVGSRDERPDRQGFAHMFEHMMFRGSAHVSSEEHMQLVTMVGGISNAFTSFDQTVYHDTLPSNHLEMALYLEADRMASFKVSEKIYKTERKVVAEEWRMRQNQPYGNQYDDFLKTAFTSHSYRWTPIGNMDHLRAAGVDELQDFFNTYYLPNNATLVVAGDVDLQAAHHLVQKYFAWIPAGPPVNRSIPSEPPREAARISEVAYRVPLSAVMIGYHLPPYRNPDHDALKLLADVLGSGRSSRLHRALVESAHPQAVEAEASEMRLEDAGLFIVGATVMQGKDAQAVEEQLKGVVADVVASGVTAEELEKAKTLERVALVHGRQDAAALATQLGEEALFGGDANRVNSALARINAVTLDDMRRVATAYLVPAHSTTLRVKPDPLGRQARAAATRAAMDIAVQPSSRPVTPRVVQFPADYPQHPPVTDAQPKVHFATGEESDVNGVRVIVMHDPRLPLVSWSLTTRGGSYFDPAGKQGLSSLADQMPRRGAGDLTGAQLSEDLEARGITLEVTDAGDVTQIAGSCMTSELPHAMQRTRQVLFEPTFPEAEFDKLREQTVNQLRLSRESATTVAGNELNATLFGAASPLGRYATPSSVSGLSLDEVKAAYRRNLEPRGAILLLAGDVTVEQGQEIARKLLAGWQAPSSGAPALSIPPASAPTARRIILVDRPAGKQATVRMGIPAYDIHADDKFAGAVAGQILSAGINSRLGRYVRAERGLAYGVRGLFQPSRHGGLFVGATDTAAESTADAIEAMFKVFDEMRSANVTDTELLQAKNRVAGQMAMSIQTIQEQATFRVEGILNGYPIDYYDQYPARIARVTANDVRDVMNRYVRDNQMTLIVVAPAEQVKSQLQRLGPVQVLPMPAQRPGATTQPAPDLLKPAA